MELASHETGFFQHLQERPRRRGQTLENMALLLAAQGNIADALEWARQAVQVLETTEDEAAKAKARKLIEDWEGGRGVR